MSRTSVGVLRGGTSSEYDLSLKTGAAMLSALPSETYDVRDILIDKSGVWYLRGSPFTPARALSQLDVVLNALHGGVGEDGTVQRLLHRAGVPMAGSSALASSVALNKIRTHEILERAGVRMPRSASFTLNTKLDTAEMAELTFSQFGPPYVVKPPSDGASHGIIFAPTLHKLPDALGDVLDQFGAALVEQFISGKHASVGVIEDFRREKLYALPPARVLLPHGARMLEHAHHTSGALQHHVPSDFTYDEKYALMKLARAAHTALDLSHFSRADIVVAPSGPYLLEMNTTPGLYPGASFPAMLESVGSSVREFLEHIIGLARGRA